MPQKRPSLLLIFFLVVLFPFLFSQVMVVSLGKLHLSPSAALTLAISIFLGGLINIPVNLTVLADGVVLQPLDAFGRPRAFPAIMRVRQEAVIAVNLGGCLIPTGIALYELALLGLQGPHMLWVAAYVTIANTIACYFIAKPIPNVGIVMPGFIPPLVAVSLALIFAPSAAAPVAFIAGVLGPLIGADFLHLPDVQKHNTGVASIGGAGTFDGIVLSGIVAAYLA
jgi:uncharacterized membrane protein